MTKETTKQPKVKTADPKIEALVEDEPQAPAAAEQPLAKAGKRSIKAVKEAEQKQVKESKKNEAKTAESTKPAPVVKKSRSKVERAGKKYREVYKLLEKDKVYSLEEALELATKTSTTKFDSTVELHVNLGVDPKQADQNVRDTVVLPAGTGKSIKIFVFADTEDAKKAKAAGADFAGQEELLAKLDKEEIDFDVLISTPLLMAKLGKYARLLGPRGLMPSPKSGTVTTDVVTAVTEAKAGKVEYRVDQAGIVHLGIGKVSFGANKLMENATAVMNSIRSSKPSSVKGIYIKNITVSTSMGPGIKAETSTRG